MIARAAAEMNVIRLLVATSLFAFALAAFAQEATSPSAPAKAAAEDQGDAATLDDDKGAIKAATKWLELLDANQLSRAYDQCAELLKKDVTRQKFASGVRDFRKPYGKVKDRQPSKFARAHVMPGAPEGDYALIEFETTFAKKKGDEQVVWMLEKDGIWRVSGYFIR
jgi:hypothetical protein